MRIGTVESISSLFKFVSLEDAAAVPEDLTEWKGFIKFYECKKDPCKPRILFNHVFRPGYRTITSFALFLLA